MKTLFYIIRHGQSVGNKKRIYLGHTDLELTELGENQALATAQALSNVEFDAVYSSDLKRAYCTALPNAQMRGMQVVAKKELREINVGEWENQPVKFLEEKYPETFTKIWLGKFGVATPDGGESVIAAGKRFEDALRSIASDHEGKTVLVAAHAAVIRAFIGRIKAVDPEIMAEVIPWPTNASYSIVELEEDKFSVLSYSVDNHLDPKDSYRNA